MRFPGDDRRFYTLPEWAQWAIAIPLAVAGLAPEVVALWFAMFAASQGELARAALILAALVPAIPVLMSVFVFAVRPLFTLLGWCRYTSPMCVLMRFPGSAETEVHTGTSVDWIPLACSPPEPTTVNGCSPAPLRYDSAPGSASPAWRGPSRAAGLRGQSCCGGCSA